MHLRLCLLTLATIIRVGAFSAMRGREVYRTAAFVKAVCDLDCQSGLCVSHIHTGPFFSECQSTVVLFILNVFSANFIFLSLEKLVGGGTI